jgi:hypothetical protein
MQQNSFIANLLSVQHVSGNIMPIIRSSRVYRWLRHVVRNTVQMENINYELGVVTLFWHCAIVCLVRLWLSIKRDECCVGSV